MNQKIERFIRNFKASASKHSPEILTGIGIGGMLTSIVLAVKATPKALDLIAERKEILDEEDIGFAETVKVAWKCYIPTAMTCVASAACLIGASSVNTKRNAALATAYKLSETAFREYKDKVVETIGEKKERAVRDKIAKERIEKNPSSGIIMTDDGNTICYESISGRYFKSDIEKIRRAINTLNQNMMYSNSTYSSLNDLYDELDLDHTSLGDSVGWNLSDGLIEVYFSAQITDEGKPCIVIDYVTQPRYDFYKLG